MVQDEEVPLGEAEEAGLLAGWKAEVGGATQVSKEGQRGQRWVGIPLFGLMIYKLLLPLELRPCPSQICSGATLPQPPTHTQTQSLVESLPWLLTGLKEIPRQIPKAYCWRRPS